MTEHDTAEMSDADLQRHLERFRNVKAFWDDADRQKVQVIVGQLEAEVARRAARMST